MNRRGTWFLGVLVLVIGLALLFVPKKPLSKEEISSGSRKGGDEGSGLDPGVVRTGEGAARPTKPTDRVSKRTDRVLLQTFLAKGFTLDAKEVGPTSAKGNVRLNFPGGGAVEADGLWISADGDMVAEGNPVMSSGKQKITSKGGALVIHFDEDKKAVMVTTQQGMTMRQDESAGEKDEKAVND